MSGKEQIRHRVSLAEGLGARREGLGARRRSMHIGNSHESNFPERTYDLLFPGGAFSVIPHRLFRQNCCPTGQKIDARNT